MQARRIDNTGGGPGPFVYKISCVPADFADNSEIDTGIDLASDIAVDDAYVVVQTAETTATTKTVDVGLKAAESGGDADGFLDGISVAAAGEIKGAITYTDGTNQNYVSARTIGVFLSDGLDGSDAAAEAGVVNRTSHYSDAVAAKSIVITAGDASGFTEATFDVYLVCRNLVING